LFFQGCQVLLHLLAVGGGGFGQTLQTPLIVGIRMYHNGPVGPVVEPDLGFWDLIGSRFPALVGSSLGQDADLFPPVLPDSLTDDLTTGFIGRRQPGDEMEFMFRHQVQVFRGNGRTVGNIGEIIGT
jgi:hypothetical protein